MQDRIYELLLEHDDVTWRTMLYDLVKAEGMDPWDIDLVKLTQKFIQVIKEMQEADLIVSGKIFLAAAILLKVKSAHLLDHDISNLDRLINDMEAEDDELDDEHWDDADQRALDKQKKQKYTLIPRNPQPRSRKVSIHDLVEALQRAMESKKKVLEKQKPVNFKTLLPDKKIDITDLINEVYNKINYYSKKEQKKKLTFTKLLPPRAGKKEKAYTFIPMLHLENEKKIHLEQEKTFAEIYVSLQKQKAKKGQAPPAQ